MSDEGKLHLLCPSCESSDLDVLSHRCVMCGSKVPKPIRRAYETRSDAIRRHGIADSLRGDVGEIWYVDVCPRCNEPLLQPDVLKCAQCGSFGWDSALLVWE